MEEKMSLSVNVLWAKKDGEFWLPLPIHMADAAEAARRLWDDWLSRNLRRKIATGVTIDGVAVGIEFARQLLIFLAGAHDLGKASPIFQIKPSFPSSTIDELLWQSIRDAGFPLQDKYSGKKETHHWLISHEILRRNGFDDSLAVVLGGHHGKPPSAGELLGLRKAYSKSCGFDSAAWIAAQDALLVHVLAYAELSKDNAVLLKISRPVQVLLSGLIVLADWIASDANLFPLLSSESFKANSAQRANLAFAELKLPASWEPDGDWSSLYERRFDIEAKSERPVQTALLNAAQSCLKPGIFVVEAPMGEGKTEAALAAAEILAGNTGCRGIYFALPTHATSDAMFARILKWLGNFDDLGEQYSVRLAHGKADLNENYNAIPLSSRVMVDDDEGAVVVHEWLSGRKKGMLSDFELNRWRGGKHNPQPSYSKQQSFNLFL